MYTISIPEAPATSDTLEGTDIAAMRRRLQRQALATTAVLPGGVMFEDAGDHHAYHLAGDGAWRQEQAGDVLVMVHPAGHRLEVRGGHLHLVVAK